MKTTKLLTRAELVEEIRSDEEGRDILFNALFDLPFAPPSSLVALASGRARIRVEWIAAIDIVQGMFSDSEEARGLRINVTISDDEISIG